jgi:hypothetical protein
MLTSPTTCGRRCGASRRSTRACRRSASWMMTWVYSVSSRDVTSIASSCAAPRMPPSGFLISCARLRTSSLLACAWPCVRSSRSSRVCCSISIISTSTSSGPVHLADDDVHRHSCARHDGRRPGQRRICASKRPLATSLSATRRSASRSGAGSTSQSRHAAAHQRAARQAHHVLERGVHQQAWPVGADHGHHRGQVVEGLEGPGGRRRRASRRAAWRSRA